MASRASARGVFGLSPADALALLVAGHEPVAHGEILGSLPVHSQCAINLPPSDVSGTVFWQHPNGFSEILDAFHVPATSMISQSTQEECSIHLWPSFDIG